MKQILLKIGDFKLLNDGRTNFYIYYNMEQNYRKLFLQRDSNNIFYHSLLQFFDRGRVFPVYVCLDKAPGEKHSDVPGQESLQAMYIQSHEK